MNKLEKENENNINVVDISFELNAIILQRGEETKSLLNNENPLCIIGKTKKMIFFSCGDVL